jgi:hypothetical protein
MTKIKIGREHMMKNSCIHFNILNNIVTLTKGKIVHGPQVTLTAIAKTICDYEICLDSLPY